MNQNDKDPYDQEMDLAAYLAQVDAAPEPIVRNVVTGRRNQKAGDGLEQMARNWLLGSGCVNVQKIYTGWKITRWKDRKAGLAYIVPGARVNGDLMATVPVTGQSVLMEVKLTTDRASLRWSDFAPHQIEALEEQTDAGGFALVGWSDNGVELYVVRWLDLRLLGLRPGKGVDKELISMARLGTLDDAAGMDIQAR